MTARYCDPWIKQYTAMKNGRKGMKRYSLRTNEQLHPLGIDRASYFPWQIHSERNNVLQSAYRIEIPGI